MTPIVSPYAVSRWHATPAGWAAMRAKFLAANSPPVLPTSMADSIETDLSLERRTALLKRPALPTGCARIDMHTMENPADREGSPLVTFILHPSAPWSGVCMLHVSGHVSHTEDWTQYAEDPAPSDLKALILPALAAGHMVIAADMPANGTQIGGRVTDPAAWTTIGGQVTAYDGNQYLADADGGAPSTRFFTDYLVRSMNQIEHDYAPTKWVMAGHSGGGNYVAILSTMEPRFRWIGALHGGIPMTCWQGWLATGRVQRGDPEQRYASDASPIYCGGGEATDYSGLIMLSASWPGRKTFVSHGTLDDTWTLTSVADLRAKYTEMNAHLLSTGNQIEMHETAEASNDHGIHATEQAAASASLEAALRD